MPLPSPVIAAVVDALSDAYTHARLDLIFAEAGASGEPPEGSKLSKYSTWIRRVVDLEPDNALAFLGRILHLFMEEELPSEDELRKQGVPTDHAMWRRHEKRKRVERALQSSGLGYVRGGQVTRGGVQVAARQLEDLIKSRDIPALETEFQTLVERAASHPRDALSAAANILEALLGEMAEAWPGVTPPAKRTLTSLWSAMKQALKADPQNMPDPDLVKVVGAMATMVDGLQGLRDDKSRAHSLRPQVARSYKIEPRHARLVVNSALALTVFLLETWNARQPTAPRTH
jgi:hypothetical protein